MSNKCLIFNTNLWSVVMISLEAELTLWEVDLAGVDIVGVDIVEVNLVDFVRVDLVGEHQWEVLYNNLYAGRELS